MKYWDATFGAHPFFLFSPMRGLASFGQTGAARHPREGTVSKPPSYRINLRPYRILYFPILLPFALLLALFNKISPIPLKIYDLRMERIGQMAANQEEILCALDLGLLPREFRVYVHRDHPSNKTLLDMQKRVMPIHNWLLPLFDLCQKMGGLGVSSKELTRLTGRDELQVLDKTNPHLSFSEAELADAHRQCSELGIDPTKPIIPVLGRDTAYLSHIGEPTDMDSYRNVDINTYIPAMEYSADKGYQVVRMGSVVGKRLEADHPRIWDYSTSGKRTELLDIYFSATCRYFLTCGSGPDSIAAFCFHLPVLYANYLPLSYVPALTSKSLVILKKYWHIEEKRYLTLSEMLVGDRPEMYLPSQLRPLGIEVHDNTPEELLQATRELDARIDGVWEETEEDKALQRDFWAIYENRWPGLKYSCRVGADFLRANRFFTQ